ncbi:kelch repeat-containing protein [Cupriavidus sp. BIS7]|uniref:kelch repeat-containing protein n=1 Tax=Cupriavidus sp. BIS7 TaxID=1217718 RepID=UPI0002FD520E|nr:kelch repeat-containing protein [Cupriavidus sp. BIS7]
MRTSRYLNILLVPLALLAAGCHGGGGNGPTSTAPAGLHERESSVVYAEGTEIIPDTVSSSGGPITQCSVSPPLPAGLVLDPQTCAITGTPTTTAKATLYTITACNATGCASTGLELEVKATAIAPDTLSYLDSSVIYVANAPITPNTPITTGGEITQYSVSPALPAGLTLDPQTGIITGTPTAVTAPAVYTVTGSNSVDSLQTQLTLEVQAQVVPPTGLTYSDVVPVYIIGRPVVIDEPQYTGGEITQFTVSPALPAGLSIDALTGEISGTPTTPQAPTVFTITGSNAAGSVATQITIDVDTAAIGESDPADAMNQGRFLHTTTLLNDGTVLAVGGFNRGSLSSVESYNPATDTWTSVASLSQVRDSHTATLLPDGTVLVAGGESRATSALSSDEIYDPSTKTWSATGNLNQARDIHTATLLPDGTVLVAGGQNAGAAPLASAEIYDPATRAWTLTGSLSQARYSHCAVLLNTGKVLVVGGTATSATTRLASAELYDPATKTWTATGSLNQARSIFSLSLLPDGRVLASGGSDGTNTLASAEIYDPVTGVWTPTGSMKTARKFHTSTFLADGRVLVAGGSGPSDLASSELFDEASGTWSLTGSLLLARSKHTAVLLPNSHVLLVGGQFGLASSELH